jgi:hypothetical protein
MNQDSFEDKLSRQPMKSVPGDWRKEILSQAGKASHAHASLAKVVRVNPAGLAEIIGTKLKEWLWPHPVAWGGLASLWLIILGLNMITPQPRSFYAQNRLHATDQPRASVTAVEGIAPAPTCCPRNGWFDLKFYPLYHDGNTNPAIIWFTFFNTWPAPGKHLATVHHSKISSLVHSLESCPENPLSYLGPDHDPGVVHRGRELERQTQLGQLCQDPG